MLQCWWLRGAPGHVTRTLMGKKPKKQVPARQDNQKRQLAVNHPLARAWTEAVRALFCGTLSARYCLLSLCPGTLVPGNSGPLVPGPPSPAVGMELPTSPRDGEQNRDPPTPAAGPQGAPGNNRHLSAGLSYLIKKALVMDAHVRARSTGRNKNLR